MGAKGNHHPRTELQIEHLTCQGMPHLFRNFPEEASKHGYFSSKGFNQEGAEDTHCDEEAPKYRDLKD